MKKVVIAGLLVSAAVFVVASFFLPRRFVLKKSTDVAAPASYLYEEIHDLGRWPRWAYWFRDNPEIEYGEPRIGTEAHCRWEGRSGTGEVTLLTNRLNEMVRAHLDFGRQGSAKWEFRFVPDTLTPNKTRLIVEAEVDQEEYNTIWSRWKRFLLANRLASALTHNLFTLRRTAESKPIFSNITEELLAPSYYIGVRERHHRDSTADQVRALHARLALALKNVAVAADGHPFCLFIDSSTIEVAIPVAPDISLPDSHTVNQHYSGRAVRGIDYDGYDDIACTHSEVLRYIRYKDYVIAGTPWEVYTTNLAEDPSTWVTEVYYPITIKKDDHDIL